MLDEKGRLFGKINIVDALIVIVILAAVAFVGIKYVMPGKDAGPAESNLEMVFFVQDTTKYAAGGLQKGAKVWNASDKVDLGTVVSWKEEEYYEPIADKEDGNIIMYNNPDKRSLHITIDAVGSVGDYGATINDVLFGVGHSMVIYCGTSKLFGTVEAVSVK